MKRHIGTFHKSGTALFESILKKARNRDVLVPWLYHEGDAPHNWEIAFDYHSRKLIKTLEPDPMKARYVICIRDPRDIIVSAAYYHCSSKEEWLHVPQDKFGGMTYQEKINSLDDIQDRFLFEMENSSYWQIQNMLSVPLSAESIYLTRLEILVKDYKLWEFHKIFDFLEVDTPKLVNLLQIAYENSLFSGNIAKSVHARSGKPAQYATEFSPKTLSRYYEIFGDAAVRLGYDDVQMQQCV